MSTLPGIASKGEKGKQRYRSLDINSLYQPEQHPQKNLLPRRNAGMQSLGKIPPTRRVPANLPSLKSEHSGNDPAVSLVPSGSTGWGSKPGETGPQPPQSTTATTPTTQSSTPVSTVAAQQQQQQQQPSVTSTSSTPTTVVTSVVTTTAPAIPTQSSHGDKSWSAITSSGGESVPSYFAHQSPYFQQEFPSLSGSDAGTTPCPPMTTKPDTQYATGPSLRPQTEGSWMQGGSRPQGQMGVGAGNPQGTAPVQGPLPLPHLPPGIDMGGGRNNLGQSGVGVAQGGPVPPQGHHMPPPHFKAAMPPFMYRTNFTSGFPPNFTNPMHGQLRTRAVISYPNENRPAPAADPEDLVPRPIIKEEDLNRMDDIARDAGWAGQDDIDYNQELTFSDDEGGQEKESSKNKTSRTPTQTREQEKHSEKDSESVDREDRSSRENGREKTSTQPPENRTGPPEPTRGWQQPRSPAEYRPSPPNVMNFPPQALRSHSHHMNDGGRLLDDDEIWQEKLRVQNMQVALAAEKARQRKNEVEKRYEESRQAIERAKQRKEEEEKRYEESRQAATKKLQKLEEKMGVSSSSGSAADDKDRTETSTPPTSNVVTSQTVNIALPDWEKDKDKDRSRTSSEGKEDRSTKESVDNFRQMTQLESRSNFIHERERERDRDMRGERDLSSQHPVSGQPAFSRQFQSNLPPRFQRQQAERPQPSYFRQQSGGSPQPPSTASMCEPRWTSSNHFQGSSGSLKGRRNRTDSEVSDRDREDDRSGKDSMRERRDRNTPDNNYERDRYRHDRGRDNRAGNNVYDNKWKSSAGYYDGPDYNSSYRDHDRSHQYDRQRERDQEIDDRRDRDAWEREKESRYYDEHMSVEKKSNDSYKPHASAPLDPFDDRDTHQMARHENERIDRDRDSDRGSMSERRSDYDKEQMMSEQPQRSEPSQHSDSRDRPERPQRPDSRDSRASRESRNSRDSMREDTKSIQECVNDREFSWADSHFEPEPKEERPKRKDYREERRDMYPSYPQRHIPGPITRERLEAAERGNEPTKRNMLPLVRSDKKSDLKKPESQNKQEQKSEDVQDAWQLAAPSVSEPSPPPQPVSKSWAETTEEPASTSPVPDKSLSNEQANVSETIRSEGAEESQQQQKSEPVESNAVAKSERDEHELNHRIDSHREKGGRGGRGVRHDTRGGPRQSWGSSMYRSAWRGEGRGRRGGSRGQPRPQTNQDWGHSDSEASADEISASTESGKEERERRQERGCKNAPRSPKQVSRKADKENRSRESRRNDSEKPSYNDTRHYEKRGGYESQRPVGCGREGGFAPRGEPSRRGRGAAFRSRGNTPNVGQRVNSYGPPTSSKSPFTSQSSSTNEDKKVEEIDKNAEVAGERKNDDQQDHCTSSVDMSVEDKTKKNQQLLSAGIKGSGSRQSTKPPRYKSENDRRERGSKSKDESRRNQRGSLKGNGTGGSGSGGDQGDEAWETTSEMSEQDDKDREDLHEPQRRNYSSGRHVSRGNGRRNSHSARSGGDKRGPDRSREVSCSTSSANAGAGSGQINMNGRGPAVSSKMSSSSTPSPNNPKDQVPMYRGDDAKYSDSNSIFQTDSKKQQRTDKEKNSVNRVPDMSNFSSMVVVDGRTEEEHSLFAPDSGFQEVRSKKNVKEANRQQKDDAPQKGPRGGSTGSKDRGKSGNKPPVAQSPSPVCGLPSIGAPVSQNNPLQPTNKTFDRKLSNKLPPRLMKQKQQQQQQLRQQQQQQQQQQEEVAEMNKLNQGVLPLFPIKDITSPAPPPTVNAWDKPITALRSASSPPTSTNMQLALGTQDSCGIDIGEHPPSGASSQRSSPSGEKALSKMSREAVEKTVLDGTSPPVQTIIFENTSLKEKISVPGDLAMKTKYNHHLKNQRMDKTRDRKLEDESGHVGLGGFKPAGADMKTQDSKNDPIQMPVSFNKNEDSADMKLDFAFDSELSQLTDDKTSKGMGLPHSMQMVQSSSAADSKLLNFKIASVKKVWENSISTVMEHHSEDGNVSTSSSFTPGFGNSVEDPTSYVKSSVGVMDGSGVVQVDDSSSLNSGEVYSTGQQMQSSGNSYSTGSVVSVPNVIKTDPNSSSSNVCKLLAPQVKPQPQVVMSSPGLGGHPHPGPLSPPPGAFNSSSAQPSGHMNFQPAAQYSSVGVSAIPSPPAMMYGSQQIPAQELYHQTFQIGNTQVMGGQARSQLSQLPPYGLSQGFGQTSAFNQQSVYLQTPPSGGPPPDLYQSQFRLQPHSYGSSQTMSSNHSAVLISSSSNSLMSASVKPSSQQIGAIGSKGGFQPSQPSTTMFIQYDPNSVMNQNYSHLVQQRPGNNIVPTMQPSSSFYSASAGGGATGFYQPTNSTLQAAQTAQTIPTQYGVQGYSTQSPAAAQVGPVGMPTYTSQQVSRLLLQNPAAPGTAGAVGSRAVPPPAVHRSSSPAQPRATTRSPRTTMSHR